MTVHRQVLEILRMGMPGSAEAFCAAARGDNGTLLTALVDLLDAYYGQDASKLSATLNTLREFKVCLQLIHPLLKS